MIEVSSKPLQCLLFTSLLSLSLSSNSIADELPEIVVESSIFKPLLNNQLNPALTVLNKTLIAQEMAISLGETLRNIPGVSSTHFTAGSSRPTIRGLGANRIQILDNGSDIGDVSSLSDDHAVAVDVHAAEQIEIIRGPAALRYGPSASGGVINIVSKRLAKKREPFSLKASSQYDSVNNGETLSIDTNGSYQNFTWHLDALKQDSQDTEIDGYADSHEPEHKGKINNTHSKKDIASIGLGYITDAFRIAFALTDTKHKYGLPSQHEEEEGEHEDEEEHSAMKIDMKQQRYDLEAEFFKTNPYLASVLLRTSYKDYKHDELSDDGDVSIRFDNEEWDSRIELRSHMMKTWTYALGLQSNVRDISAVGEESLLQPVDRDQTGIFGIAQHQGENLGLELGLRADSIEYSSDQGDKSFNNYSISAGTSWSFANGIRTHALFARSERAPQELALYGYGEHHASGTFEKGNSKIDKEVSHNIEIGVRRAYKDRSWEIASFFNHIDNYIHAASEDINNDGIADRVEHDGSFDAEGELLSVRYANRDAQFYGFEAQYNQKLDVNNHYWLDMTLFADYVRARFTESGKDDVPRITPPSIGMSLALPYDLWIAQADLRHVFKQTNNAKLETETNSYNQFDLMLKREINFEKSSVDVYFKINNLFDIRAREHASFSKDYVPLAGRSVQLGMKLFY